MNATHRIRIGITVGDPAGIGPEIVLRALDDAGLPATVQPIVYGDAALLRRVADAAGIEFPSTLRILPARRATAALPANTPVLLDFNFAELDGIRPGQVQAAAGRAAADWIRAAADDAMAGHVDAIVTGPIHKSALALAGVAHPGHTGFLAERTATTAPPVMIFMAPELVVALATIHMAWQDVPAALTSAGIERAIRLTAAVLARRLSRAPRIGVLALNPHAGEDGRFGHEEHAVIRPAIEAARAAGLDVQGPLVPDAAFRPESRRAFDAFVAMAHDQGLIPFKMLAFDHGVNVTLGLPIVRTSVDHGTAFDIAWRGIASCGSLVQAIRLAAELTPPPPAP